MTDTIVPYVDLNQHGLTLLLTKLPAGVLTKVSYASVRGRDEEAGAVQRYLNTARINAIKEFTLSGGQFPNAIVLNWIASEPPLAKDNGNLIVPSSADRAAQLIDGQHRVAGLKAAIEQDASFATLEIPVAIYEGLNTAQCANIFLAINTEQKPVPRSLVFDLYGIASNEQHIDQAAYRARDIVMALHEDNQSPYYDLIKLPGSPRKKGGIALSTAVTAIKPLVEDKGDFEQINVRELESQKQALLNYFSVIKDKYAEEWEANSNAFMYAAGFVGGIDFFRKRLIPYCSTKQSFSKVTLSNAINLHLSDLIKQEEVKGIGGKDAPKRIFERLNDMFEPEIETSQNMQF